MSVCSADMVFTERVPYGSTAAVVLQNRRKKARRWSLRNPGKVATIVVDCLSVSYKDGAVCGNGKPAAKRERTAIDPDKLRPEVYTAEAWVEGGNCWYVLCRDTVPRCAVDETHRAVAMKIKADARRASAGCCAYAIFNDSDVPGMHSVYQYVDGRNVSATLEDGRGNVLMRLKRGWP